MNETHRAVPEVTQNLLQFIEQSPTPYHCADNARRMLEDSGFKALHEGDAWRLEPGCGYFIVRDGTVVAWRLGSQAPSDAGYRIVGAHTDSPNLRVKPMADTTAQGYAQLGVEVYGGALTHTWLDRDLGLAGRVALEPEQGGQRGPELRLVRIDEPLLRIPSLAIHLYREIKSEGLKLNAQDHLQPILGLAPAGESSETPPQRLAGLLAEVLDVPQQRVLGWDLCLMDIAAPRVGGLSGDMIFSPRLDNQAMCHAALSALLQASSGPQTQVSVLYDHEEVGSETAPGAAGPIVEDVLARLSTLGDDRDAGAGMYRAKARSFQVSADMAHAVHPNYADKHEPQHRPKLNGGPVIKINANQRYATAADGAALFETVCRRSDVPYQKFVSRNDMPCGSTIGPISAARLGVRTVDVGNPMLSMHSIREQAGVHDHPHMVSALQEFFELEQC